MNIIPRVAAINDISGYGRVSLTEAIPVMSAMGIEVCPLPTAVLSTHTYKFENYTFCDMTEEMPKVIDHWERLGLKFDAIYSGYLGSKEQIDIVCDFINRFGSSALIVVDPVLGDNELYDNNELYSENMIGIAEEMKYLVHHADVITPNLTEACLLLGEEYISHPLSDDELCRVLKGLSELGVDKIAITSVMTGKDEMSVGVYDKSEDKYYKIDCGYVSRPFHGTGDLFTSALTGALLKGYSFIDASNLAVGFIREAIALTLKYPEMKIENGVIFEPLLAPYFAKNTYEKFYTEIGEQL